MRITDQGLLSQSLLHMEQNQTRMQETQRQALTSQKMERPSDDPVAMSQVSAQQEMLLRLAGYDRNISQVRARLGATEGSLRSFEGVVTRLREITITALNRTLVTETVVVEAKQLHEQLLSMTNQAFNGEYLYAGYNKGPAFSGSRFVGDNQKRGVEISPLGATLFGVSAKDAFGVDPGQDAFVEIADSINGMKSGDLTKMRIGLDAIDKSLSQISQSMALLGSQQNTLDMAEKANNEYRLVLQKAIGRERDVNPAEVYSQLAADRYAMEATYTILASNSRLSLLKYL